MKTVWVAWELLTAVFPCISLPDIMINASKHSSPTAESLTWRCNTTTPKRCGLLIGIWVVPPGKRTTRLLNARLTIPRTNLSENGIPLFWLSTDKKTSVSTPLKAWELSMPLVCVAFRHNTCTSRKNVTGYWDARTESYGNVLSQHGWISG